MEQKVGFAEKKLRLWGIEGGNVANGMGQVGACNKWDRYQERIQPLVGDELR